MNVTEYDIGVPHLKVVRWI